MSAPDMRLPEREPGTVPTRPPSYPGDEITGELWEWVKACEAFKKKQRRQFMDHSDYLRVAMSLGYRKQPQPETQQ